MTINPLIQKDFYKVDHRRQYPKRTTMVYSNLTPRGSRIKDIDYVVVFGIQYFIKEYLIKQWNEEFFSKTLTDVIFKYKRRLDNALGKDAVPIEHITQLWKLGYLPIVIKALPEGTISPMRVPILTIRNTHPDFFWLTNFLETILCNIIWGMTNSATIASKYKMILSDYAEKTSDIPDFVQWQGHDFSMRGMFGLEAACISGAGHLLSFTGTDTIPAIDFLEEYYYADSDKELIGGSVSATEHSVMCLGSIGKESEKDTYIRLLTEVYPKGIVSIVSDTWDYWKIVTETLPEIKDVIMNREGKAVIRPDSGHPVNIICGDNTANKNTPEYKGSIELLWETFGGTINSKGYKQLDSHIGLIYGDSITLERCEEICSKLEAKGFASTNVILGIGSFTYQFNTRDTLGFAMKATYGEINGEPVEIYKDPKTDTGLKKSAMGLLRVNEDKTLSEHVTWKEEKEGLLKTVFLNSKLVLSYSLQEIRDRLNNEIKEYMEKK